MTKKKKFYACHSCRCHLSAPCNACVNCNHYDVEEDCEHDCQDCTGHRD
jgi:hypothetical protein